MKKFGVLFFCKLLDIISFLCYTYKVELRDCPDSSVGRAKDWKSLCRRFNSVSGQCCGCSLVVKLQPSKLAMWVRFPSSALCISGSVVEHRLAKARVAGSNPVLCLIFLFYIIKKTTIIIVVFLFLIRINKSEHV